jgi:hypothetical protein
MRLRGDEEREREMVRYYGKRHHVGLSRFQSLFFE